MSQIPLPLSAAWEEIWATAAEKSGVVGEAHLFSGILDAKNEMVAALLMLSGVSREEARLYASSWLAHGPATAEQKIEFAKSASQVLLLASREAKRDKSPFIEPHHFFIASVSHRRGAHLGEVLRPLGLDAAQLRAHLSHIRASQKPYPRGHPLNDLSEGAKIVLERAHAEMRASYCGRISAAHLLLGLLSDAEIADKLEQAGCDLEDLQKRARESIKSDGEIASLQKRFSPGARRALERAARAAKLAGRKRIDCGDLLIGLLPQDETMGEKWRARGRELDGVEELWTAEQLESLSRRLGGHTHNRVKRTSKAKRTLLRFLNAVCGVSLVAGMSWGHVIANASNQSATQFTFVILGFWVPLISGVGLCIATFFNLPPYIKHFCLNVFAGWLVGTFSGAILSYL